MAREGDSAAPRIGQARGPYDIGNLDASAADLGNSHLDLGSVLIPVVEGGQVTVEMSGDHQPEAVYLVTPHGRVSVTAFAAPKSPGLWREVVRELVESLRNDGASTRVEDGHWGREVVAEVDGGTHRFIGVDGSRWMVRCVASGPSESATELAQLARAVLAESVVRRGDHPAPPREMLPIVLPPVLAEQVAAAQQQMFAEAAAAQGIEVPEGFPTSEAFAAPAGFPDAEDLLGSHDRAAHQSVSSVETGEPAQGDDGVPEELLARSSGSAMQRFRRRRRG
ncbi:MAG: DUF3710 domain-containing protein [Gordonia sp. (in: high G+C Gram-positive bacteria)]